MPPGLQPLNELGRGTFATVWRAMMETPSGLQVVAVKCIRLKNDTNTHSVARELAAVRRFSGGYFLKFYEALEFKGTTFIITELASGTLQANVIDQPFEEVSLKRRLQLVRDLAKGVSVMHEQGFVHRDLKPHNILLSAESDGCEVRIADMGAAGSITGSCAETSLTWGDRQLDVGTPVYLPPEALGPVKRWSFTSDVWSMGIILYQMLFEGSLPAVVYEERQTLDDFMMAWQVFCVENDELFSRARTEADPRGKVLKPVLQLVHAMTRSQSHNRLHALEVAQGISAILEGASENDFDEAERFVRRLKNRVAKEARSHFKD